MPTDETILPRLVNDEPQKVNRLAENLKAFTVQPFHPRSIGITPVRNCPTCHSPSPTLHPAMQYEGEVQRCRDDWHKQGVTR